jgi:hypothetical protein
MYLFLICSGTGLEIKYRSPLSDGAWKSNTDSELVPPSELKGICQIDHSHFLPNLFQFITEPIQHYMF